MDPTGARLAGARGELVKGLFPRGIPLVEAAGEALRRHGLMPERGYLAGA
jgi:hypothetical protein